METVQSLESEGRGVVGQNPSDVEAKPRVESYDEDAGSCEKLASLEDRGGELNEHGEEKREEVEFLTGEEALGEGGCETVSREEGKRGDASRKRGAHFDACDTSLPVSSNPPPAENSIETKTETGAGSDVGTRISTAIGSGTGSRSVTGAATGTRMRTGTWNGKAQELIQSQAQASSFFPWASLFFGNSSFSAEPDRILEGLYLGGYQSVSNKDHLLSLNVKSILTVARSLPPPFPDSFKYTLVEVEDLAHVDMMQHLDTCFNAIDEGRAAGGVVVHCFAGVSRSATVVIAYLMKTKLMTFKKALGHVKKCRPIVNPNMGFVKQLEAYDAQLAPVRREGRCL